MGIPNTTLEGGAPHSNKLEVSENWGVIIRGGGGGCSRRRGGLEYVRVEYTLNRCTSIAGHASTSSYFFVLL